MTFHGRLSFECSPRFRGQITSKFLLRKGLVPFQLRKNFLGLALLLLILRSRADRMGKLPKPYLLCISFTQRFRGRITSIFFCWKALDLYFECPSKFWTLSATINWSREPNSSYHLKTVSER